MLALEERRNYRRNESKGSKNWSSDGIDLIVSFETNRKLNINWKLEGEGQWAISPSKSNTNPLKIDLRPTSPLTRERLDDLRNENRYTETIKRIWI